MRTRFIAIYLLLSFFIKSQAQQPGDIKTICSQTIPTGWICINVGNLCDSLNPYGGPGSFTRTIEYYVGLPPGSKINMSADVVPAGWVKTTLSYGPVLPAIVDGKVGFSIYFNSTIEKVEGLETSDSIITVDQAIPDGWIGTNVTGLMVGNVIYPVIPIVKIDKMDPNRTYTTRSSIPPPGWLITGSTFTGDVGSVFYQLWIIQNHLNMPVGRQVTAIDNGFYSGSVVPDGWSVNATGQIPINLTIYNTYTITKKQSRVSGLGYGIWTKRGSPYVLTGTVNIPINNVLTIEPGVTAKFSNSSVNMLVDGTLDAEGNTTDSIYFKGTANGTFLRGGYINLTGSGSVLKYVNIDSLGEVGYSNAAVNITDGITPTVSNTTIKHSGTSDVYSSIDGIQNFSNFNGIIGISTSTISKNETVLKISGNNSYKLLSSFTVPTGRTLTVQPGVKMYFPSLSSMYVDGKLDAQGSSTDSIYFKGTTSNGYRSGFINLNSDSSTLNYVSIDSLGDAYFSEGSLYLSDGITPTVKNTSIRHSGLYDIYSWIGGAKNLANINGIVSVFSSTLSKDAIMPKVGGTSYYKMLSSFTVPVKRKLTIQPGVKIYFPSLSSMYVDGKLDAQGSSTDSIYFKGTTSNGYRSGFINLNSDSSTLNYVSIDSLGDAYFSEGSLYLSDGITPTVKNTSIRHSGLYDIYSWIGGAKNLANINGIVSVFSSTLSKDAIMPKVGGTSYYRLLSSFTVPTGRTLTVQPGVKMYFPSLSSMYVDGKLNAQGSSTDSIYFKGTTSNGYRSGFINLNSDSSTLNYVSIDSLGDAYFSEGTLYMTARSTINSCTIKNSGSAGIFSTTSGGKISASIITNNPIGILVSQGKPLLSNNQIFGNTTFGINNTGSTDTVDATNTYWGTTSGPYHPTLNPTGTGNKVSDRVKFVPWKSKVDTAQCMVTASSTSGTITCHGDSTTITVTASGGVAPYTGTGTFKVKAGNYSFTVADAKGCMATISDTISEPSAVTVTATAPAISCNGGTTTITVKASGGTPPYTSGTGTSTVKAGTYTYKVTDSHGCTGTKTITITEPAAITVSIADVYAVNPGGDANTIYLGYGATSLTYKAIVQGGNSGYKYSWKDVSTNTVIATTQSVKVVPAVPGTYQYTVTVTDKKGCIGTATKTVTVKDIRCGTNQVTVCKNGSQSLCVNTSKVSSYLSSGSYLGTCISTSHKNSDAIDNDLIVDQHNGDASLKIFPNPSTGIFTLQLSNIKADKAEISIIDTKGVIIIAKLLHNLQGIQTESFDLSHIASGIYIMKITTQTQVKTIPIIIAH